MNPTINSLEIKGKNNDNDVQIKKQLGKSFNIKNKSDLNDKRCSIKKSEHYLHNKYHENDEFFNNSLSSDDKTRKKSRSTSKSSERDFTFRKREKKSRNYRRSESFKSPSPIKSKSSEKCIKYKYPKNWEEFNRDKWTFKKLENKYSPGKYSTNDVYKQLLFDKSELIQPFYYKNDKGDEKLLPFEYLRYTTVKPIIPYSVSIKNHKELYLNRQEVLNKTNKKFKVILDKFYGKTSRTKFKSVEQIGQRNWYHKNWKDTECKALETSIGLSFLQNYSDGEEEDEELNKTIEEGEIIEEKKDENSEENTPKSLIDEIKNRKSTTEEISKKESWTPERLTQIDMFEDVIEDESKTKSIPLSIDLKKIKKIRKKSESESSSSTSSSSSSDKKKSNKKKQRKVKEKKSKKKKEKLKAEKLKLKKQKKKEVEKEILKKLKKEIELNLEEVNREELVDETDIPMIKIKIEKEEINEKLIRPVGDLRNLLNKKKKDEEIKVSSKIVNVNDKKIKEERDILRKAKEILMGVDLPPFNKSFDGDPSEFGIASKDDLDEPHKDASCRTPDTDEYHSNWESDDGISPIVINKTNKKLNKNWESDEELLFGRSFNKPIQESPSLEMPLNIKKFSRRNNNFNKTSPKFLDVDKEIKFLEEERKNLSKERMELEIEKIRIHELEKKQNKENLEWKDKKKLNKHTRWDSKDDHVDSTSKLIDSPEITSTKSPIPTLESAYQEFIKAVSVKDDLPKSTEKQIKKIEKDEFNILSTSEQINLQEILLPGELNIPIPVPSPKIIDNLPSNVLTSTPTIHENDKSLIEETSPSKKSFTFSTLILPTKKPSLLENSKWNLDESDDETKEIEEELIETKEISKKDDNEKEDEFKKDEPIKKENMKRKHSKSPPVDVPKDKRKKDDERRKKDRRKDGRCSRRSNSPNNRELSPRRRRISPTYRRTPPRLRTSPRRRRSPPRWRRSITPPKHIGNRRRSPSPPSRYYRSTRSPKSPLRSPIDGPKRNVALPDSTISDDLLPPYMGECSNSPLNTITPALISKRTRFSSSPKRPSLDERINQVLGIENEQQTWKQQEEHDYQYNYQDYHQYDVPPPQINYTSKVLQVGNILQVVPTDDLCLPPPPVQQPPPKVELPPAKILQVGNMLQIVPTELPPLTQLIENQPKEEIKIEKTSPEKILTDRLKKRQDKENRKKEKERKKKEKTKKKKLKLKVTTEEMIKRALQLEGIDEDVNDINVVVPIIINDTPGIDPSKSILSNSTLKYQDDSYKTDKGKSVRFADGILPGEGTSPSGGEDLSSPPPQTEDIPKHKKYRRIENLKRKKRKIKVKVIKRRPSISESDEEYENLPPPSPPPGSPPSHIFPQRVKVHTVNNIPPHYLSSYGLTGTPQVLNQPPPNYQTQSVYRNPPPNYVRTGQVSPMIGHPIIHNTTPHHPPYGPF